MKEKLKQIIESWRQAIKLDGQKFIDEKPIYPVSTSQYKYCKSLYEEGKMSQEEFERYVEMKLLPIYRKQEKRLPNNVRFRK